MCLRLPARRLTSPGLLMPGPRRSQRSVARTHDTPRHVSGRCWRCNTNKGAGDDADVLRISQSYAVTEGHLPCPYLTSTVAT